MPAPTGFLRHKLSLAALLLLGTATVISAATYQVGPGRTYTDHGFPLE